MKTSENKRYEYLDILRGITLISMIFYHAMWDLVYIAGMDVSWYPSQGAHIWQQSICWTFILLSGFCWSFGRNKIKRGLIVFAAGAVITLVTSIVMPNQRVMFGVLTFLGSAMLLMIPLEKLLRKVSATCGLAVTFLLFFVTKSINWGTLGFGGWQLMELPDKWYNCGYAMTFLGFLDKDFYSTDYFSLLPWIFLFVAGYFLYRILAERKWLDAPLLMSIQCKPLSLIGRYSLLIYMLHQPIIYFIVVCLFR